MFHFVVLWCFLLSIVVLCCSLVSFDSFDVHCYPCCPLVSFFVQQITITSMLTHGDPCLPMLTHAHRKIHVKVCHSLSLVVFCCPLLSFVVTCCHLSSFVVHFCPLLSI